MCYIAVCLTRKLTDSEIGLYWSLNPDGAGVGWASGGRCHIMKGFRKLREFQQFYRGFSFQSHVVHFRFATSGRVVGELTHPFPVMSTAPVSLCWSGGAPIMVYNGHWAKWEQELFALPEFRWAIRESGRLWSDARGIAALAGRLREAMPDLSRDELDDMLEEMGRFVLIYPDGDIRIIGEFLEADGILQNFPPILPGNPGRVKRIGKRLEF